MIQELWVIIRGEMIHEPWIMIHAFLQCNIRAEIIDGDK